MAGVQGDIYRATVSAFAVGQLIQNTLHFRLTESRSDAGMASALAGQNAGLKLHWTNSVIALAHEDVLFTDMTITKVFGLGDQHTEQFIWDLEGEQNNVQLLPTFTALPIHLRTGLGGRGNRGRFHWGPILEEFQEAGRLNGAGENARNLIVARLQMITDPAGTALQLCVHSRKGSAALFLADPTNWPSNAHLSNRAVTAVEAGSVLGTMYSRKIGRGA